MRGSSQPLALSRGPAQVIEAQALRLWRRRWRRLGLRWPWRQRIGGLPSAHRARRIAVKVDARRPLDQCGAVLRTGRVDTQHPLERVTADNAAKAGHECAIDTALERLPLGRIARECPGKTLAQ